MFITNIRYGDLPVRKVYLGEKLIWQCIEVQGETVSDSYASAKTYIVALLPSAGMSESMSNTEAVSRAFGVKLMNGEAKSLTELYAICRNFPVLLISGISESGSDALASGNVWDAILLGAQAMSESNTHAKSHIFNAVDMFTEATSSSDELSVGRLFVLICASSSGSDNYSKALAHADCAFRVKVYSVSESQSDSCAVSHLGEVSLLSGTSYGEMDSNAIGRMLDILLSQGETLTISDGVATARIHPPLVLKGIGESEFDCNATLMILQIKLMHGYGEGESYGIGNGEAHSAVLGSSDTENKNNTSTRMILWYPPIGDGILLVENTDVDITQNGNTLEIRQAYQINIDNENKILEVV